MSGTDLPAKRFSRDDLDRVIRRAAELQFGEGEREGAPEGVDEAELLRIGSEVGIEERHLRRAMDELRAEALRPALPEDRGVFARALGRGLIQASRVISGPLENVEMRLERHFSTAESLARVRKRGGRSLWEPAGGFLASVQRELRWRGFRYDLARAGGVELVLASLDDGYLLVTITADLRRMRRETGAGWIGGTTLGFGAAGWGVGLAAGLPFLAIPGVLAGGWAGARLGRSRFSETVERVRLSMEGILDQLESGEPLPGERVRRLTDPASP